MIICWDTIDSIKLKDNGDFVKNSTVYIYKDSCVCCRGPYLTTKYRVSNFCSHSCSLKGENHPQFGKKFSKEWRNKLSLAAKIRFSDNRNNPNYKGGVEKAGLPLFDTFYSQIPDESKPYVNEDDLVLLSVRCTYCNRWFVPTIIGVRARIGALNSDVNGRTCGEGRFYCSTGCKNSCPTFRQRKYPKKFKKATSREVQPELRKLVLERDGWKCQVCFKDISEVELHCHHILPINESPIESADVSNCITLCKNHHKEVHKKPGCCINDLKCKN